MLDTDAERARATARGYARPYLGMSNYTNNLLALGSTGEDIAGDGSDHLIDAVIPHGTAGEIAAVVRAHLDAGADHVAVQALGEPGIPRQGWSAAGGSACCGSSRSAFQDERSVWSGWIALEPDDRRSTVRNRQVRPSSALRSTRMPARCARPPRGVAGTPPPLEQESRLPCDAAGAPARSHHPSHTRSS